jgi:hypothetical protein
MKKLVALFIVLVPLASAGAQSHVLVVTGIGGEARYSDQFFEIGKSFVESASVRHGVDPKAIVLLTEDPAREPAIIGGKSTRENVEKEIQRIAATARPGDHVVIALIGHGSSQGGEGKFNLPGLDLGATDYSRLLGQLSQQRVAFLNLSSGSGDFVGVLSAPNRVIITATKTGFERNESLFAKYFVDAFTQDVADADKDGRVSLYEAFDYGRRETIRFYEDDGRMLTEHAMLDDNGDKVGAHEPDPRAEGKDGSYARSFFLGGRVAAGAAAGNPRLAALLQEKADIESALEKLRQAKATMDPAQYEQQLEKLLVDLANNAKLIRDAGGGGPD